MPVPSTLFAGDVHGDVLQPLDRHPQRRHAQQAAQGAGQGVPGGAVGCGAGVDRDGRAGRTRWGCGVRGLYVHTGGRTGRTRWVVWGRGRTGQGVPGGTLGDGAGVDRAYQVGRLGAGQGWTGTGGQGVPGGPVGCGVRDRYVRSRGRTGVWERGKVGQGQQDTAYQMGPWACAGMCGGELQAGGRRRGVPGTTGSATRCEDAPS